jgi:two-component sensor histidine kinase
MRPGMEKNDYDSASFFMKQVMNLSSKLNDPLLQAKCFRVYSQLYRESNQAGIGKNYINRAISILAKENQKEKLADAYFELQQYYNAWSDSEWTFKVRYAEMAEQLYKESGNKLKQAGALKHLGDFYQIQGKDSIALKCLNEALAVYKSIQYQEVEGIYDLIGYILCSQGKFNQGLKYGLLAIETAERLKTDSHELSTIYNRTGITCYRLSRFEEAGNYFAKSFEIASRNKDTLSLMNIGANLLGTYIKLGKQQELLAFLKQLNFMYEQGDVRTKALYLSNWIGAYLLTGDYKKAEPFVKQMFRLIGNSDNDNLLYILHFTIIPYYFAAGQYTEMYKYLPSNERYSKKFSVAVALADNYLWWFKADSALENYTAAITHYKLYKEASDSSMRLTATRELNELLVEYESFKKDQEIVAKENNIKLLTQQDQFQEIKLHQGSILRNISFGVLGLLIIIMALLYNRYRLKQRTNKKLEFQQAEIESQNVSLHHLVNEKDWLVKEIHHRVKNNLQIVMSLLNSQSAYIDNESALTAIHDSQHRVNAMALIHQKLYSSENLSSIDMSLYIRELVSYLADSFNTGQRIRFEHNIEPLEMDVSQAVPLGLILNEAITNSIKYAFPDNRSGVVSISLSNTAVNQYLLTISDSGVGIASNFAKRKIGSLGMSLMQGLSEDLNGDFAIENNNGTTIKISFIRDNGVRHQDTVASSIVSNN